MPTELTRADYVGAGNYDSIAWAFQVHIQEPDSGRYNFGMLHGSEDAPDKIELWEKEPAHDTPPDRIWKEAANVS